MFSKENFQRPIDLTLMKWGIDWDIWNTYKNVPEWRYYICHIDPDKIKNHKNYLSLSFMLFHWKLLLDCSNSAVRGQPYETKERFIWNDIDRPNYNVHRAFSIAFDL